jgi:predicted transposase YdaD
MDAYSDEHTYEVLLRQEREKSEQALEQALFEKELEKELEKEQALLAIAQNMLKLGNDMEQIVRIVGLSEEEIRGGAL